MYKTILIFIFSTLFFAVSAQNQFRYSMKLSPIWQIQPATTPDKQPDKEWATTDINDGWWLYRLKEKNISWEKEFRKKHSRWYRQELEVPANWQGKRILIDFSRIDSDCIIFINKKRVGELLTPGGKLDLTTFINLGQTNELSVFSTRDYTGISRNEEQDILRKTARKRLGITVLGRPLGIAGPVTLTAIPHNVAITDIFIITSWRKKTLTLDIELDSQQNTNALQAQVLVLDKNNESVLNFISKPFNTEQGIQNHQISHLWDNPIPWELDAPYLYTLKVKLLKSRIPVDSFPPIQFGFREVYTQGRNFMMNGHPCRWRVGRFTGLNKNSLSYYRLLGYNVHHAGAHPKAWWCGWWGYHDTPDYDRQKFAEMYDQTGTGYAGGVPTINWIRELILTNPDALRQYQREMAYYVRKMRNHPAILAWSVGMNSYNPRDGILPKSFGQKKFKGAHKLQQNFINKAMSVLREVDPTRPVYSYADGNIGDISTSNTYTNLAPLQEREDWPEIWAKQGDMPAFPAEFGQPYDANFWQNKRFLLTEYLAKFYGDEAYKAESLEVIPKVMKRGLANKGHGKLTTDIIVDYPLYYKMLAMFVKNTDRAWRTWGMLAWHYWDFKGFGLPEGYWPRAKRHALTFSRYSKLKEPVSEMPSWANKNAEIYSPTMQPLLVYIAGNPVHTDKTHSYFSGSEVKKQIAWVWDGPGQRKLTAKWQVIDSSNNTIKSESVSETLNAGVIRFTPLSFKAPSVDTPKDYKIILTVFDGTQKVSSDQFTFQVFPKYKPLSLSCKTAVIDPKGLTAAWLKKLGINFTPIQIDANIDDYDLVIIGREALQPGMTFPVSAKHIKQGKQVIIFEQKLEIWEGLGLQTEAIMCRRVFIRDKSNPICSGLTNNDLENWRGSPDLLPAFKAARNHAFRRAPRSSNRNTVASIMLRIPQTVGFTPILVGEFDMNYSPLLTWRYGLGQMIVCSLDLTDRVGVSPAATTLATNLLRYTTNKQQKAGFAKYVGDQKSIKFLQSIQCGLNSEKAKLIIIGKATKQQDTASLLEQAHDGATLFFLPQKAGFLDKMNLKTEQKELYKTSVPVNIPYFKAISLNLLRWRDNMNVLAFSKDQSVKTHIFGDGLFAHRQHGKGNLFFSQLDPQDLLERYTTAKDKMTRQKRANITLSIEHIYQLYSQLLTNMNASPSAASAKRVTTLELGPAYKWLHSWNVLGPFYAENAKSAIQSEFPVEKMAIQGDFNPNITFKTNDGRMLDWRPTVSADTEGYVDLAKALNTNNKPATAYLIHHFKSPEARMARMRLGVNYYTKIWVNEKLVYSMTKHHGKAQANHFECNISLKKGENSISAKVASGKDGFGLWLNISEPGADLHETKKEKEVNLYPQADLSWDPYEYHYW